MRPSRPSIFAGLLLMATTPIFAGTMVSGQPAQPPAWTDEPPVLARMLEEGYRAERNRLPQLAAARYCKAARFGSIEAQYLLGRLLIMKPHGTTEEDNAIALLALAARQGHEGAQRLLVGTQAGTTDMDAALPDCLLSDDSAALADSGEAVPNEVVEQFIVALPSDRRRHARLVQRLAPRYNVDPRLALAIVRAESNFDPNARSPRNALGLMQLIPDTAARFGVHDALDPEQNIRGGLAYLNWLLKRFEGDVLLTAAAYNAGEGAVERHGGVPPYGETQEYVRRILAFYRTVHHEAPVLRADLAAAGVES